MTRARFAAVATLSIGIFLTSNIHASSMIWYGNSFSDAGHIWKNVPLMLNCNCGVTENVTIDSLLPRIIPSCWLDCQEVSWGTPFSNIDNGHFDYVVAQNNTAGWVQSSYSSSGPGQAAQLTTWANHAKAAGGVLVIEQIWLNTSSIYTAADQDKSDFWYDSISRVTNSIMPPCGRAWWIARQANPGLEYIDPNWNDGNHPGTFGGYLNECCFFAAITGVSPVGINFKITTFASDITLSDANALFAQQKAWEAYQYFHPASNPTIANFAATPAIVVQNNPYSIVFSATVTGSNPITSVLLDLGAVGGPANVAMTANGSTYSYTYTFPQNVPIGTKTVSVRATDNANHYQIARLPFKIEKPLAVSTVKSIHYNTRVRVFFSEILDKTTAETAANYSIDQGVTISSAKLEDDPKIVTLTTSALSTGANYSLKVSNAKDDAGSIIPANTTTGFTFRNPSPGAPYSYYEAASITSFADLASLTPKSTGINTNFNLTPAQTSGNFALVYSGLISTPKLGKYTFFITADDQGEIYIDDSLVITTNYSSGEKSNVVPLSADFHKITVRQFQNFGGQGLAVAWSGPSFAKGAIPDSVLFYDPPGSVRTLRNAVSTSDRGATICRAHNGNVLIRSGTRDACHVTVYSPSGRIVKSGSLDKGASMVLTSQAFSSGIYIIRINNGGITETERVKIGF
jgi:hypothetical protein